MSADTQQRPAANVDPAELAKFGSLAHQWWDPESDMFGPLHRMNPLRLAHIERLAGGLEGKRAIDVGCGGGILAESMAQRGARVTGIDLAEKSLKVAMLHRLESGVEVDYRLVSAEEAAAAEPGAFDVVTCMEMLEHVPEPDAMLRTLATLLRPGGRLFVSTLNRNLRSFLMAIVGAEYVARIVAPGTHEYEKMIRPAELARWARGAGLELLEFAGLEYNPVTELCTLTRDVRVNYLAAFERPREA